MRKPRLPIAFLRVAASTANVLQEMPLIAAPAPAQIWNNQLVTPLQGERLVRISELIQRLVAGQQSVFDERDLARCLHTFVNTEVQFTRAFERAKAHPDLVKIAEPETDGRGQTIAPAKFTTKTMLALEALMSASAERLSGSTWGRRGVRNIEAAIKASPTKLSDEQAAAVRHISLGADLASIVGCAGAGKSTLLRVAADAWCGSGKDVVGGALASKAARGLAEAWGIRSQALARWITLWRHGQEQLSEHSVFVLDDAGMVGSAQMAAVVAEVVRAGAKLVLVGDPEQLQPIAAGGAFRALVAQCGAFELAGVRRQHDAWARKATVAFQRGQVEEAMQAYVTHGAVQFSDTRLEAAAALVEQYIAALGRPSRSGQPGSQIALAHRNDDILLLNTAIHERRAAAGHLGPDIAVSTTKGERVIARGDRILFLKNADLLSESGEKIRISNSDLGTITAIAGSDNGPLLDVAVDGGKSIRFSTADYSDFDFEYATTVHKSQSASLDRVFVFASATMDKSLAYVAMSRHRDDCTAFVPTSELADFKALTWAFSRTAPKATTLDYAEKRGLVPKSAIPRDLELRVKLGRAALAILRQTFERTLTHYRVARIAFEAKIAQRPRADEKSKDVSSRPRRTMDYSPQARARDRAQLKTTNAVNNVVNNVVTSFFALVENKRTGNKALPHQVDAIKSSLQALDDLHPGWARHLKGTLYSDAAFVKSLAGLRPDQVAGAAIKRIE